MGIKGLYSGIMVLALGLGMSGSAFGVQPGMPYGGNNQQQQHQGWKAKLARWYTQAVDQMPGFGIGMGVGGGIVAAVATGSSRTVNGTAALVTYGTDAIAPSVVQVGLDGWRKWFAGIVLGSLLWREVYRGVNYAVPRCHDSNAVIRISKLLVTTGIAGAIAYYGGPALISSGQWLFNSLSAKSCGACGASGW